MDTQHRRFSDPQMEVGPITRYKRVEEVIYSQHGRYPFGPCPDTSMRACWAFRITGPESGTKRQRVVFRWSAAVIQRDLKAGNKRAHAPRISIRARMDRTE
jgi:hypothetical protein